MRAVMEGEASSLKGLYNPGRTTDGQTDRLPSDPNECPSPPTERIERGLTLRVYLYA